MGKTTELGSGGKVRSPAMPSSLPLSKPTLPPEPGIPRNVRTVDKVSPGRQAEFERRLGAAGGRRAEQPEGGEVAGVDEESDYSSESSDSSWFAREDVKDKTCQ